MKILVGAIITTVALSLGAVQHYNLSKKNVAVKGYDVVSYFDGSAEKGSESIAYEFEGATYYFASEEHKKRFSSSPARFMPQYGGWCAYAMALKPDKVDINPKTFKIVNGKLLLFYNQFGINTLNSWNEWNNDAKYMADAQKHWEQILNGNE